MQKSFIKISILHLNQMQKFNKEVEYKKKKNCKDYFAPPLVLVTMIDDVGKFF